LSGYAALTRPTVQSRAIAAKLRHQKATEQRRAAQEANYAASKQPVEKSPCMTDKAHRSLMDYFGQVPDPRMTRTQRHELLDVLAIALCAVIGGADPRKEVVEFAQSRQAWFATFLKLPNGIASRDTFARVFRLINAQALQAACQQWLASLVRRVSGVVAIDGKSVRGARDGNKHPLHIVSAGASEHGMLLGQVRTAKKSNEINAIPELLKLLSIERCIVTIDAMGCQKAIAKDITTSGADYVLGLNANHRHLCLGVAAGFDKGLTEGFGKHACRPYLKPAQSGHGRIEQREHWLMAVPKHLQRVAKDWRGLQTIAMVRRQRQVGGKTSSEDNYYISGLPPSAGAEVIAKAVRSHWAVENERHWSLNVAFREMPVRCARTTRPPTLPASGAWR
jgi:predicted transposase YbfD/YdcC